MAGRPPVRVDRKRGPRATDKLPGRPDARRTWTGPPYERTPGRWSGTTDFGGTKHHVGTFDTPAEWGTARDTLRDLLKARAAADAERRMPPKLKKLSEFVGPRGEQWPWDYKRRGKRKSQDHFYELERHIRKLTALYGDRYLAGGISRAEAMKFSDEHTRAEVSAASALFTDARFLDPTLMNPFDGLTHPAPEGRNELDGILTVAEVARLKELSLECHGDYGFVMAAMVEVAATLGCRPSELWGMEWVLLDLANSAINLQLAIKKGALGLPKNDSRRLVVLAPSAIESILNMPRLHDRWVFPTKQGALHRSSGWGAYWYPVRAAFTSELAEDHWLRRRIERQAQARRDEPELARRKAIKDGQLDFYELRHRAATFMYTPKPDGLGLDVKDIAYQLGHKDGGELLLKTYVHIDAEETRKRIRRALHGA